MPAKSVFNAEQRKILQQALTRLTKRFTQLELVPKLGIKQQSISDLVAGKYAPSYKTALAIAKLDGKTLDALVGDIGGFDPTATTPLGWSPTPLMPDSFPNLDTCIAFHAQTKQWSPWTIAAAREGFFGAADFPAPEWEGKLDLLEKALEKARKAS